MEHFLSITVRDVSVSGNKKDLAISEKRRGHPPTPQVGQPCVVLAALLLDLEPEAAWPGAGPGAPAASAVGAFVVLDLLGRTSDSASSRSPPP